MFSKATALLMSDGLCLASVAVMAAVSVVLPWSMCPIVPMLTWGLLRSNFALAIAYLL